MESRMTRSVLVDCPHCGCEFPLGKSGKPRSLDQHRRYFAMMRAVFMHWPESHEKQFADEKECRKWLQMKAGHREITARIPVIGVDREKVRIIAEAAIRAAGAYAIPVVHGTDLIVFKPESIAFHKLSHLAFCALNDAVDEVIRAETGLDPNQLLQEQETAA
jgi:hypothetical protein